MMLQLIQQFAGINTAMYYSAMIIQMAGFTDNTQAIWLSTMIAATNAVFTVVSLFLIDRVGRRSLLFGSMPFASLFLGVLGFAFYTQANPLFGPNNATVSGILALASLALYVAFFAIGLGPVPWTVNSEIYPLQVRSKANSIATTVNWGSNLIVSFTFLTLTTYITKYGAFWLYSGIVLVSIAYVYFFLPETMGKSMEQIQQELSGRDRSTFKIENTTKAWLDASPGSYQNGGNHKTNGEDDVIKLED